MKKYILNKIEIAIKKQYPDYSETKIEEIMYGVEGLYITITKSIIIIGLALILKIFIPLITLLILFNIIRLFAFGMHAPNGTICLVISALVFLLCAYFAKTLVLNVYIIIALYAISFINLLLFAPADTVKRPIIKARKRKIYKALSLLILICYITLSFFIKNNLIINCLIFSAVIESILVNPISYKIFKLPYNNYKNYGLNVK